MKHSFRTIHIFALALIALFVCIGIAAAQDATGRIIGNVTDPSGSPVEGAKIHVENIDTHIAEETVSDRARRMS